MYWLPANNATKLAPTGFPHRSATAPKGGGGGLWLHHVNAKGIPARAVCTVNAPAKAIHNTAKPHTGTPNRTAKTFIPSASCGSTASLAFAPSNPAAVMD